MKKNSRQKKILDRHNLLDAHLKKIPDWVPLAASARSSQLTALS